MLRRTAIRRVFPDERTTLGRLQALAEAFTVAPLPPASLKE